jgi:hypothetical protein
MKYLRFLLFSMLCILCVQTVSAQGVVRRNKPKQEQQQKQKPKQNSGGQRRQTNTNRSNSSSNSNNAHVQVQQQQTQQTQQTQQMQPVQATGSGVSGSHGGHDYVNLGLPSGTLWATRNVGASRPEDYGDYFAWGETRGYKSGKSDFSWSTYKWCNGSSDKLTKYCTSSSYGTVDNRTELSPEDDAVYANWGSGWRMPTDDQQTELREKCRWTWTSRNGVKGYEVKGPNGNLLFLPAAGYRYDASLYNAGGYGFYWSRTLCSGSPNYAFSLWCYSDRLVRLVSFRYNGQSVRPVRAQGL